MAKQILFGQEGRQKLSAGMQTLAQAVRATLGPSGKNVILEKSYSGPVSTKDGITVSKEIELPDPFENMGAKILNEVASRTNDDVGDGTSTAVVLANRMIEEGRKYIAAGCQPTDLRRGIDKAVAGAVEAIRELAIPVKDYDAVRHVAYIASNSDEQLADLLAEALSEVTDNGVVTIEENKGTDTYLEVVQGLKFDKGYISPYFMTNPKDMTVEFEDPYIFFFEKKITSLNDFVPLLEKATMSGKPLLIISEDVEGEALAALVINKLQGVLRVAAVKAPGFGDRRRNLLEDMAVLTGGLLISEDRGMSFDQVELSHFGSAKKIIITKDDTTIINGGGKKAAIDERIEQINVQLEQTTSTYDKEKLIERKAKLGGGVAVLYVGGHTETEMKERKGRATDALHATRAAIEEGIVPGGGTVCIRAMEAIESLKGRGDEKPGISIVRAALEEPLRIIAENGGRDGGEVVAEVCDRKGRVGFDAMTGEYYDLVKAGIVDPAKVTVRALENAASIAGLNLSTDTLITDVGDKKDPVEGAVT
ncbi:MAG: chaperonin GroEL [Planctomycetota bacterium]|nr:chaperonin GroEL [Planctomycetota bacterium]